MDLFVAIDGDRIGRMVGRLSMQDDEEGLRRVSHAIEAGNRVWASWVAEAMGSMISAGGDEARFRVPADRLQDLQAVRRRYETAVGATASVGVGTRLSEADRALLAAKLRGGDQVVLYTPDVEQEVRQAREKSESEKLSDEYLEERVLGKGELLEKADPPAGPQAREAPENKPNAGGGFSGRHEPGTEAEPTPPAAEASEHSEGEQMSTLADEEPQPETTHSVQDFEDLMHGAAQQQDDQERAVQQGQDALSQTKQRVVQILQQVRQQAPALEQLQQAAPELYQAVQGVVASLILTARALVDTQEPAAQQGQEQPERSGEVQKSELLEKATPELTSPPAAVRQAPQLHSTVEGFMGGLKALPRGTPDRGKFITSHMNHAPFLAALGAHPQGAQVKAMLNQHLNAAGNAGFRAGSTQVMAKIEDAFDEMAKVAPPGFSEEPMRELKAKHGEESAFKIAWAAHKKMGEKAELEKSALPMPKQAPTHPHLDLPVGSVKDGKVKVQHEDGHKGWVSVRAGQVLSNDGHPVSSRNPGGR